MSMARLFLPPALVKALHLLYGFHVHIGFRNIGGRIGSEDNTVGFSTRAPNLRTNSRSTARVPTALPLKDLLNIKVVQNAS